MLLPSAAAAAAAILLLAACLQPAAACLQTITEVARVPENTTVGSLIKPLKAGMTNPSISSVDKGFSSCYFSVNTSGVYLVRSVDLENLTSCDKSTVTEYITTLTLTCGLDSSSLVVRLEPLDEFDPYFLKSEYTFNISEATLNLTKVYEFKGQVADADKAESTDYRFAIVGGDAGLFTMGFDGETAGIVKLNGTLDYDAGPASRQYRVNVSATTIPDPRKTAYTLLVINIEDADDLSPKFTQDTYRLTFVENDTSVINKSLDTSPKLQANDLDTGINQQLRYTIQSGASISGQPFITIDPVTGQFTVIRIVDREALATSELLLQVKAYQTDKPDTRIALATVIVVIADRNDNAPVISPTSVTVRVAENSPADTFVTRLSASDKDANSNFQFHIVDSSGAFQIDATSGVVTVRNSSLLDRETVTSFSFLVFAQEASTAERYSSDNASVTVQLTDVNDNSPEFTQPNYLFNVSETAAIDTVVGWVNASDSDLGSNGEIRYSLTHASGNGASMFKVEAGTGRLLVSGSLSSNSEFVSAYQLVVAATDQAAVAKDRRSSSAIVQVNVRSSFASAPRFTRSVFAVSITEASPIGTEALRLTATDKDPGSTLSYSLLNTTDKFTVTSAGNEGFVRVAATLDRESVDFYSFVAVVSDGNLTSTALVQIRILDFNDERPRFANASYSFPVTENSANGSPVGRVAASDADAPNSANSRLSYSLLGAQAATFFDINATSGEISTKAPLDRESLASISFQVLASDAGEPRLSASADVSVAVGDVNDNAPEFDASVPTNVALPERAASASFLQLKFTDADAGANRDSRFALLPPSDLGGVFVVNDTTGFLSATRALTSSVFGNSNKHNLTVVVFNTLPLVGGGTNRTLTITVSLQADKDNRPISDNSCCCCHCCCIGVAAAAAVAAFCFNWLQ